MAEYKLTYFDIKGLAEPIRFILKYGNIAFEDDRFPFDKWDQVKPKTPFGQVPILVHGGTEYNQSTAICRYFAKKVGLGGKTELEDLEIDAIVDSITDMRIQISKWYYDPDENIKATRKDQVLKVQVPFFLERFDKVVQKNNGYFACKRLTWADLFFAALLDLFNHYCGKDLLASHPNLKANTQKVFELPAIKKWIEQRPKTDF